MNRLFPVIAAALGLSLSAPADAARMALDPQNRLHMGVSMADGVGFTTGLDSRLTRLIYIDLAGFVSPLNQPVVSVDPDSDDPKSWFNLRHGVMVAPGIRVPHRYGQGWNWDFTGRVGMSVLWVNDASQDYDFQTQPGLLGGGDLLLRRRAVGLRAGGKAFMFKSWSKEEREELVLWRSLWSVEAVYQW